MCGIFGLSLQKSARPQEWWEALLHKVNTTQKHRGPDEQNIWIDTDRRIGFAHQRLSILDLSPAGQQPMISHSGQSLIAFNGEIYNHQELRSRRPDHHWRGHSDTEILLENLESSGVSLLKDLNGMFAFGFLNLKQRRLLLATDPAGEKPLYTYWDGRVFAFSSELRSFKLLKDFDLSRSDEQLKEYLIYGYIPHPQTMFKNIRKLPAGSFQWIDLEKGPESVQSYWDLPIHEPRQKISYQDAQISLRSILSEAVKRRLVADVPVGSFLSGGLDSSVVSLLAADAVRPQPLNTFSVSFNTAGVPAHYDESTYARLVAKKIHSKHHEILIDPNTIKGDMIPELFDEPFADSSAIPTYYLSQETAKHVKVVLSGDGGDELFGGYLRFRAGLISAQYAWLLRPLLSPISFKAPRPRSWQGFLSRFKGRLGQTTLQQQLSWNSYFSQEDFEKFLGETFEKNYLRVRDFEKLTEGLSVLQKILYYNFKTYLFDDLLPKVDRMSMAHGLEVRSPFLDKELIHFAFTLPDAYKVTRFDTKRILKDAFATDLGADFVRRKKQGFALPIENFIAKEKNQVLPNTQEHWPQFKWGPDSAEQLQKLNEHHKIYLLLCLEKTLSRPK